MCNLFNELGPIDTYLRRGSDTIEAKFILVDRETGTNRASLDCSTLFNNLQIEGFFVESSLAPLVIVEGSEDGPDNQILFPPPLDVSAVAPSTFPSSDAAG